MNITDEKLYELCKEYGARARLWRQKFIGLLPEVARRCLYERKGFSSVFEFAFKLCGLSEEQVRLTLNLGKRFEDKPILKSMLENGEASINKLARVASIATPENEEGLAEKVKVLSKSALETFIRDEKYLQNVNMSQGFEGQSLKNENGLQKTFFEAKCLPGQTCLSGRQALFTGQTKLMSGGCLSADSGQTLNFELSDDVKKELNELNSKGFDVNELLREMLKKRQTEIEEEKEEIAKNIKPAKSGYISVKIKKILHKEHGKKCSISTCQKPATTLHHTQRFGLSQNHDPRYLAPLCEEHHAIAHSIDIKYHKARAAVIS